eukprot:6198571-Pleurochrysis_carterae.AAC.3
MQVSRLACRKAAQPVCASREEPAKCRWYMRAPCARTRSAARSVATGGQQRAWLKMCMLRGGGSRRIGLAQRQRGKVGCEKVLGFEYKYRTCRLLATLDGITP